MQNLIFNCRLERLPKALFLTIFLCSSLIFLPSCKDECADIHCMNNGTCSYGTCSCPTGYAGLSCERRTQSSVTYMNNTFTTVSLIANGITKLIEPGMSATITGTPGDYITGSAFTKGTFGRTITWTMGFTFGDLDKTIAIDVNNQYFFLKVRNVGIESINEITVNNGLRRSYMTISIYPTMAPRME